MNLRLHTNSDWAAAALAAIYAALAFRGPPLAYEDAQSYREWASSLIERRYDFAVFLREVVWTGGDLRQYLSWIALVAAAIEVFGPYWQYAIVGINVACYALVGLLLLRECPRLADSPWARPLVLVLLLFLWDYHYWARHVLADSLMNLISTVVLLALCRGVNRQGPGAGALGWLVGAAVSVVALTFKPQAIGLVALTLGAAIVAPMIVGTFEASHLARRLRLVLLVVLVAAVLTAFVFGLAVFDSAIVPTAWLRETVAVQMAGYGLDGSIIWQRYETYVAPPRDAADFAAMVGLRALYMFAPFARDYSVLHSAVNIVGLLPLYGMALVGAWSIVSGQTSPNAQRTGLLALGSIIALTLLHSLTAIDYDWRYRVPLFPPMILLAVIGLGRISGSDR